MDDKRRRAALRLITYGTYVLGAAHEGEVGAATVTWVTQASFEPPLVVLGVNRAGRTWQLLKQSRRLALSFLESGQRDLAYAFFKPALLEDGKLGGHAFETARTGAPILSDALGFLEAEVRNLDETGDHAVVIAEIVNADVRRAGTPLALRELGLNYGG